MITSGNELEHSHPPLVGHSFFSTFRFRRLLVTQAIEPLIDLLLFSLESPPAEVALQPRYDAPECGHLPARFPALQHRRREAFVYFLLGRKTKNVSSVQQASYGTQKSEKKNEKSKCIINLENSYEVQSSTLKNTHR